MTVLFESRQVKSLSDLQVFKQSLYDRFYGANYPRINNEKIRTAGDIREIQSNIQQAQSDLEHHWDHRDLNDPVCPSHEIRLCYQ